MLRVTQVTRGTEVMPLSGAAEASVMVANVFEKPPKVSGVSAEAAQCGDSSCGLRVSWEAPAASPPLTEQFVQHRREDKPNGWARMDVPASATEALVTGAQPGRRHLVRVRVRNKAGRSEWSEAAMANTAPLVTASAENGGVASLGEGGGRTLVRLAGSATARGGGTLSGRWFRVYPKPNHQQDEIVLPAGPRFAMESGREYDGRHAPSSDSPEARFYRLVVTHDLSGDSTVGSSGDLPLVWLPQVLLRASPSSVPEDGRTRTVRVEAELTGQSVSSLPKEVVVEVKGGTATLGTDFTADSDFTISIPGGARSAFGTFSLRPRADSVAEGGETVRLQGRASEGPHILEVLPTEVTIEDDLVMLTVSPVPTNGKVTGPGIDCGAGSSGKCSEKVTKSSTPSLTASPSSGYVFDEWSGACSSKKEASCEIVVSRATTVGASFRPPKLTVLVLPAAGGSVSGTGIDCGSGTSEDCVESVSGGSIALTASPASGHAVRFWSGGGCSGTGRTCTAVVTADETVTVAFVEQPAPAAPSGLAAAPGNGQVTLSWTDPGNATITGYEVRHKAGAGAYGAWAGISGSGAGTTSHIVTGLANGTAHSFQLRAENSTGAGASATVSATPSRTPSADAGADQTVSMRALVTLDGSGSSEPDGESLSYDWRQTSGTTVTLSDAAASAPTFRAPSDAALVSESLTFSLKVSDPHDLSDTDSVTVTAENQAPTVDAGSEASVLTGSSVTLVGSAGDPEGGEPTYNWRQTGGTTVTLSSTTAQSPTFTAPSNAGLATETLTFRLMATDPAELSNSDTVAVTVRNRAPTADAGDDQSVAKGATVTLDGGDSNDPEGGELTYAWSQTGMTTVTLSSTTASQPTFTAPSSDGTLTFSLTATDPANLADTDTVTVTVENQPPTALVPDQSVAKGATVTLDGSGSSDPENGALTYSWSQTGGTTVTLSSTTVAKPTFTAPNSDGTLTFRLTVTDPQGLSGVDTGTVTVENQRPTANAGANQTVYRSASVTLDGSGSSDPEDGALTYSWSQTSGTTVTLSSATVSKPTFTAPSSNGTLVFSLMVTDPEGLSSAADSVTVTVTTPPPPPPPPNRPPVARAGPDQTPKMGDPVPVTLNGSNSYDPDGADSSLKYKWTQTSGTTVTLAPAQPSASAFTTLPRRTFTAPSNAAKLTLVTDFRLTVRDEGYLTDSDSVKITARNQKPTLAPVSQTVFTGVPTVTLDARATDPEGGTLSYAWSQTAGTTVPLSSTEASNPTFTAPSSGTTLTYSVTVQDLATLTASGALTVKVLELTCEAGANQPVNMGATAWLRGSCEKDAGVGPLRYQWSQKSGATVSLRNANQAEASFTAPINASKKTETLEFEFEGSVSTPTSHNDKDQTAVTATNQKPTAVAGPDQSKGVGKTVTLDGGGSSDPEGGTLTYVWTQTSGTTVSLAAVVNRDDKTEPEKRKFTAPSSSGALRFRLTVTDPAALKHSDTVNVTVTNRSPNANPGVHQTVSIGNTVTLDGGNSSDPDGQELTYAWTQTRGTTVTLDDVENDDDEDEPAKKKFTAPGRSGVLDFRLTVTDTGGLSDSATTKVTVRSHRVRVSPTPTNGKVTGGDLKCGAGVRGTSVCSVEVAPGASLTLTASPSSSYERRSWAGTCASSTGATCVLNNIRADKTLGTNFDKAKVQTAAERTVESIYQEASSRPARPTGGTAVANHTPSNWTRSKPNPCASSAASPPAHSPLYRSQRTLTVWNSDNAFKSATTWSAPVELLTVDAAGPYTATLNSNGIFPSTYTVTVRAQAYGGVPPYEYQWGKSLSSYPSRSTWSASRSAYYVYLASLIRVTSTDVTIMAREKNTPATTACHKAKINFGAVGGASGEAASALPMSVGGELLLIWGGEGSFTASSEDPAIASITVDGAAIIVSGVSAGSTAINVQVGSDRIQVPVEVGSG